MPPPTPPSVNDGRMMAGKPDFLDYRESLIDRLGDAARRHLDADFAHGVAKQQPIFRHLDRIDGRANQLNAVRGQRAPLGKRHRQVERGLPSNRGQHGIGPLLLDDRLGHFRRQRLDIRAIRHLRVRHDGGGIAVDEDDLEPFRPQRLAGLRARVVEFARLADDDRSGPDDEHPFDVSTLGHQRDTEPRRTRTQ